MSKYEISEVPFRILETALVSAALTCAAEVRLLLQEHAEQPPTTLQLAQSDSEVLFLFIHLTNRFAFAAGGEEGHALVRGKVVDSTLFEVARAMWSPGGQTQSEFDVWMKKLLVEQSMNLRSAEAEYGECDVLFRKRDFGAMDTMVGRLSTTVSSIVERGGDPVLKMLIESKVVDALAASSLKKQVEIALAAAANHAP